MITVLDLKNRVKKKTIIIGCSGSGKSFFAKKLSEKTGIPRYYLDCIYWQENWVPLPRPEFIEKLELIMQNDEWIIDGNYQFTLENRMKETEVVFFLDIDEEVCIASESARRGNKREDLPSYLVEEYDPEFINFIKNFKNNGRIYILELLEKYKNEKEIIIFKTREEVNKYLEN